MQTFEIDFDYKIEEFGGISMDTDETDMEKVEALAMSEIKETYPDIVDVQINTIKVVPVKQ